MGLRKFFITSFSTFLCNYRVYLILACEAFTAGMLHQSTSEAEANFWNKWPFIVGIPSLVSIAEYSLEISGRTQMLRMVTGILSFAQDVKG